MLGNKGIEFVLDYSSDLYHIPVLFTEDSIYSFKGISQIRDYVSGITGEEFTWEDLNLEFFSSEYLGTSGEFWKLEFLLGTKEIYEVLKMERLLNKSKIKQLFLKSSFKFFVDSKYNILSSSNSELLCSEFGDLIELSLFDSSEAFGINNLVEAKEKGYLELKGFVLV